VTDSSTTYAFHACGLTIHTDRPLPGLRPIDAPAQLAGPPATLNLHTGELRKIPKVAPAGEPLADPTEQYRDFYAAVRDEDGFLVRFFAGCDVRISEDLTEATHHRAPDADDGLIDVLLSGTLLATVVALRGTCVLHASAVETQGRALAFVGHSGMGKSTLAIAACGAGARLIAEDVLAVTEGTSGPNCLPGNTDIRLRKGSVSLIERLEDAERIRTPDGRDGVRPPLAPEVPTPLVGVVIPRPSRSAKELSMERMPPVSALFRLMNFPRVNGLNEPGVVRTQFKVIGDIARQTPVWTVTVPWGPPFQDELGAKLLGFALHG
jgi:hypothetical protein